MTRHVIWHNDACEHYDWLKNNLDEVRDARGLEDGEEVPEEMLWDEAHATIEADYEAECDNLEDCKTGGEIIAIGDLERWNGTKSAYAEVKGDSVADIVRHVASAASRGDNTAHLFVENGDIVLEMWGHDNPITPTRMVYRAIRKNASKDAVISAFYENNADRWTVAARRTKKLGYLPAAVYGWKNSRKAA